MRGKWSPWPIFWQEKFLGRRHMKTTKNFENKGDAMKILGRSLLNYERSRKRLHPNQRPIWRAARWSRAAKMEPAARCPGEPPNGTAQLPDAQDHMESSQMEPSCQDGANCQMPRRAAKRAAKRNRPAAGCPGPLPSRRSHRWTRPPRAAKWNHPGPRPSCWSNW